MNGSATFRRARSALRSRPQTRRLPQTAAWRDVVCSILEGHRAAVVNALSIGAVRAEHHPWPTARADEETEGDAGGHLREIAIQAV